MTDCKFANIRNSARLDERKLQVISKRQSSNLLSISIGCIVISGPFRLQFDGVMSTSERVPKNLPGTACKRGQRTRSGLNASPTHLECLIILLLLLLFFFFFLRRLACIHIGMRYSCSSLSTRQTVERRKRVCLGYAAPPWRHHRVLDTISLKSHPLSKYGYPRFLGSNKNKV